MKIKMDSNNIADLVKEIGGSDEKRLQELISTYTKEYVESLLGMYEGDTYGKGDEEISGTILETESPIERLFFVAMQKNLKQNGFLVEDGSVFFASQYEVSFLDKSYRVDFVLSHLHKNSAKQIFIELNGHEYHNATKEKVEHDRRRERALQNRCDRMMTFTGTEVYKDADGCANEVVKVLKKLIEE